MSHSFFNQVAIGKDIEFKNFLNINDGQEADRRSTKIYQALEYFLDVKEGLSFRETKDTWLFKNNFSFRKDALSYSADMGTHVIEVMDVPPHDNGNNVSVERIIAIHRMRNGIGEEGTVFMRLSPVHSPSVNILTNKNGSNMGFIQKGKMISNVKEVTEKIIDMTDKAVPQPAWVENFDQHFTIKNDEALGIKKIFRLTK